MSVREARAAGRKTRPQRCNIETWEAAHCQHLDCTPSHAKWRLLPPPSAMMIASDLGLDINVMGKRFVFPELSNTDGSVDESIHVFRFHETFS